MDEFVIFVCKNGRSVPRFQAKERSLYAGRSPESDGSEVRIIHLDSLAGNGVDQLDAFRFPMGKDDGVDIKKGLIQRQGVAVIQISFCVVRVKLQVIQVVNRAVACLRKREFQNII